MNGWRSHFPAVDPPALLFAERFVRLRPSDPHANGARKQGQRSTDDTTCLPNLTGQCGGMASDVVKKVVRPGDIIIIPAGVVHGGLDIGEHVDYLSSRP